MPIINVEKCYETQNQYTIATENNPLPENWLSNFFQSLSEQLKFDSTGIYYAFDYATETNIQMTEQAFFINQLNRHAGKQSEYTHITILLQSLGTLYNIFTDKKTTPYHKKFIATQLNDEVTGCTPGFHDRVQTLLIQFNTPYRNLPDLIAYLRFKLVDNIANIIAANHHEGIHVHNGVFLIASVAGYGVRPINTHDVNIMYDITTISNRAIQKALKGGFSNHFQLFALLNGLTTHLKHLVQELGCTAQPTYTFTDTKKIHDYIQGFITITMEDLFERDSETFEALDICWKRVKKALYQRLIDEKYVTLLPSETALLNRFFSGQIMLSDSDTTTLPLLIPQTYELAQCLEFFNEWDIGQKATLVSAYLFGKSTDVQMNILDILYNEAPLLTDQLKNKPNISLLIAIAKNDVKAVRECIEKGANINAALPLLFSQKHKSATLDWFYENPSILQRMTAADFNVVINHPGKYNGKTVAQILAATKKGRRLIGDNITAFPNTLLSIVNEAEIEIASNPNRFFTNFNNKSMELVQSIVYGDLSRVEKNPFELIALFCEKATVKDYSKRKFIQVTAFQAALCARDDEACALLASYMQKEEWIRQYQAIFPKGHELYYSKQTPFDFQEITNAITSSSDADLQKALGFALPDNTRLWKALQTFREKFTALSCQETVFNPKHLIRAYEIYDRQFSNWRISDSKLFWLQVIGFVQRFLPSNLAMDCAQGFYARVEKKEKSKRSFRFINGGNPIFPLTFDRMYGLGYNHAVDGWGNEVEFASSVTGSELFSKLIKNKSSHLSELLTQTNIQPNFS